MGDYEFGHLGLIALVKNYIQFWRSKRIVFRVYTTTQMIQNTIKNGEEIKLILLLFIHW